MPKESPEANHIGITQLPNLASMFDGNFLELVWKDGQILMNGRSISRSCISFNSSLQSPTSQLNNDPYNVHPIKRPKMGNVDSISGDSPLLDPPGFHNLGNSPTPGIPSTSRNDQYHCEPKNQGSDQISTCGLDGSKMKQVGSGSNNQMGFQNFSLFLKPAMFVEHYGQGRVAARPISGPSSLRLEELKSGSNEKSAPLSDSSNHHPIESKIVEPGTGVNGFQSCQVDLIANITGSTTKAKEESFQDEQSEAVMKKNGISSEKCCLKLPGLNSIYLEDKMKGKPEAGKPADQLTGSTSICSRGASNDINISLRSRYGENDEKVYANEHSEEEQEEECWVTKRDAKRKQTSQGHNVSEKERREKINKRLRTLQELLPNSDKVDKASMLEEAIEYIKALQLQLQIMSMGPGLCNYMPPMMMPNGFQNMQAPQMGHLPPMAVGLGQRIPGIGCIPTPLPSSPMLGLPGQLVLPMSMSCAPSVPLIGADPQRQTVPSLGISTELLGSAPLLINPKDGAHIIYAEVINNNSSSRLQASNQGHKGSSRH